MPKARYAPASVVPFPGGSAVMLGAINLENDTLPLVEDQEIHLDPTIEVLGRYQVYSVARFLECQSFR